MLDATALPFDPVDLEPTLRPFGRSRMLPRDAYVSPRVFAFEQERFFAGSWACVGRGGDLGGAGGGWGARGRGWSGGRTGERGRRPPPAGTGAPSCSGLASRRPGGPSSA